MKAFTYCIEFWIEIVRISQYIENLFHIINRRKSKGQWDLLKSTASDVESPNKSVKTNASDSDDDSKVVIDLTEISSSEIPSDLSINEEDFWSDYEHLNDVLHITVHQ